MPGGVGGARASLAPTRFGGRVRETDQPKGWHRTPARPYTFRFNRRRARHRGLLFYRLIEGALAAEPHPYETLTSQSAA